MDVIGTIESIESKVTQKNDKPYVLLTFQENKAQMYDFGGRVEKANVREGDKVRIQPWAKNAKYIDAIERVPQDTQTDLSAIKGLKDDNKKPARTQADINSMEFCAIAKAAGAMNIEWLKHHTEEEITIIAENLVKITEEALRIWKSEKKS